MAKKLKLTARKIAIISAAITLVSFGYKLTLGILAASLVLIIASMSTLLVFLCKLFFVKSCNATREEKKKTYFVMIILLFAYAALFILFVVLKVAGIDTSNQKTYEGWLGALLIAFMLLMFVLSIIKYKGALEKNDLMVIGLKQMIFVSALTDVIIIVEYISRIILEYKEVPVLYTINTYLPLAVGVVMIIVGIKMIDRFRKYK